MGCSSWSDAANVVGRHVDSNAIFDDAPMDLQRNADRIARMDETDRRLIDALRADARAPVAQLARALGLSRTTVQSRLERLERSGVVAGYTVRLSEAHERGQIRAYVMLAVTPRHAPAVVAAIRRLPAVRALQSVSGPFDLIAEAVTPSVAQMDALIDALGALDGVERTTSSVVLSTKFDR
jgi:DNA-binding Lrp family transcriptional regulator